MTWRLQPMWNIIPPLRQVGVCAVQEHFYHFIGPSLEMRYSLSRQMPVG